MDVEGEGSTLDKPYVERRQLLEPLGLNGHAPACLVRGRGSRDGGGGKKGKEGVMAKRLDSPYLLGRRAGTGRKVKHA
ncbi:MAG: hypothetical protein ABI899_02355 [Actinomycetota bacterium]